MTDVRQGIFTMQYGSFNLTRHLVGGRIKNTIIIAETGRGCAWARDRLTGGKN